MRILLDGVTNRDRRALSERMRSSFFPALGGACGLFLALTLARMDATLASVLDSLTRPPTAVQILMTTITRSKTIDGTLHSQTWTQRDGEDYEVFLQRVEREWAAYCRSIGG